MENVFEDYIKRETERMKETPNMIVNPTDRWVILEESSDNIEKFYLYMSKRNISLEDVRIYYNDTETYFKIQEGIELRGKLEKERKRQERLENPKVWQEVKDIETKEQLIEYLMDYWYKTKHGNIWEYSSDIEVAEKRLEVTAEELNKKIKELL